MQTTNIKINPYIYPGLVNINRTEKQIYSDEKNKMFIHLKPASVFSDLAFSIKKTT